MTIDLDKVKQIAQGNWKLELGKGEIGEVCRRMLQAETNIVELEIAHKANEQALTLKENEIRKLVSRTAAAENKLAETQTSKPIDHSDNISIDIFADAMKKKMAIAREQGRHGWDDTRVCSNDDLAKMLWEHLTKTNSNNFVDIANFCMMLHIRAADPAILEHRVAQVKTYHECQELQGLQKEFVEESLAAIHEINIGEFTKYSKRSEKTVTDPEAFNW